MISNFITHKNRVIISGLGIVSPLGCTIADYEQNLRAGKSGIKRIEGFNTENFPIKVAGQALDFDPSAFFEDRVLKTMDRFCQMGMVAAIKAWKAALIGQSGIAKDRCGVYFGSGIGGIQTVRDAVLSFFDSDYPYKSNAFTIPRIMVNSLSGQICMQMGITGKNLMVCTACSSGANAMGQAFEDIKDGKLDAALCGAAEAQVQKESLWNWNLLKLLCRENRDPENAGRPFDLNRSGFVLSEGAAAMVLESLESARHRNAPILCEVIGYACNCDASHITRPNPKGQSNAIRLALESACIQPDDVHYINAHGTGTKINDIVETKTIKAVFGKRAYSIPISSTKSMTGHAMGASSAFEIVATVLALKSGFLPPTINYQTPDPECDLDYVPNIAREFDLNIAISNSFAFGGNNSVIVLKKWNKT